MSQFDELITQAEGVDLKERKQFIHYLLNVSQQSGKKLPDNDKNAILKFAYRQIDIYLAAIPDASCYRDKDEIFEQEDMVLGIIMALCPAPGSVPPEMLMKIQALAKMVEEERKIETTLDNIFTRDSIQESDINSLLYWVKQTRDEYQRAVIYSGLLHYRDRIRLFTDGAKQKLSSHLHSEMRRILDMEKIVAEPLNALELLADVCKLFPCEDTPALLMNLLCLRQNQISFYAVESLLFLGQEVPAWAVEELAHDLVRANLIYSTLENFGQTDLFPLELRNEVYLAKSYLVHWLTYPTELGQTPDEIEYIGRIKYLFKKDVYHIFKFRSASETLGEDLKDKWLIGWASKDGGTFSNFDELDKFDLGDTDKTLKNIKKKLIG